MNLMLDQEIRVLGIDAGGTMTDAVLIDDRGHFVVGKAQSTPDDESLGVVHSIEDALGYWEKGLADGLGTIASGVFSGTSMMNRLLERKGQRVGLIVTLGQEDYLLMERGIQTWLGYTYADTLHVVTHRHREPLVPRSLVKGVGGRITVDGSEAIPLYENDVRKAAIELLQENVDSICVNLLFSWRNTSHEDRVCEIVNEIMADQGTTVPLHASSVLCPTRGDFARLNTLVINAYAAEPSRKQLNQIRSRINDVGGRFDLRLMSSSGGTISIDSKQLVNSLCSGPIGGIVGAKYLAELIGIENIACSDIGGTSFDIGLIVGSRYEITPEADIEYFRLNLPMVKVDSIGAGSGSLVRVDPVSRRIEFGPDSAGSRIGTSFREGGVETVSITDCTLVLGLLNPDYFLGGAVDLDVDRARRAIEEQIAMPLNLSVEEAASGVVELLEYELRREVLALLKARGIAPEDFTLLCYGGGGPLHVGGYTDSIDFEDVLIPSWAAGFSAFGCACADLSYRFDHQLDLEISPSIDDDGRAEVARGITKSWEELRSLASSEFEKSGTAIEDIDWQPYLRMQYLGQLNDIEVASPMQVIESGADLDVLIAEFERIYTSVFAGSAKSPDLGYSITLSTVIGSVPTEKPVIPQEALAGPVPPVTSRKASRLIYWRGETIEADIYEMSELRAGNVIDGLAVIEAPSTTFVVPPKRAATLDERRIFHLGDAK